MKKTIKAVQSKPAATGNRRRPIEDRIAKLRIGEAVKFSNASAGSLIRSANAAAARVSPRVYRVHKTKNGISVTRLLDRVV